MRVYFAGGDFHIGRIRDGVPYFVHEMEERVLTSSLGNYRGGGCRKLQDQTSLCSMAQRVAALREVTPSLP
jgi:hypothetical protein